MKKTICLLVFIFSVLTGATVSAKSEWSREYSENIWRGVEYRYILKYSNGKFTKLHVLECDLTDPGISVGVMTASGGSSTLENTKKMAEANDAIVAVNGDFFNLKSAPTNMLGTVFQNGEMVSTPSKDLWATFAVTDTGKILMDYFGFSGKIFSPQGYEAELYQINKEPVNSGAINMFTPKWGSSVYCGDNMQAVLVKDGHITEKILQKGNVAFGDNDKIFLTNYTLNGFFENFNIGDEIRYEYSLVGCDGSISEATGANTLLVVDGKRAQFTNNITGYAQRTAAGIDDSGTKLILAVCEGRQTNCKGMTQEMLADAMIELGCVRAVNFDGGGSSTMVIKDEISGSVAVKNNVTALRNVSTSVGIFNRSEYLGNISGGMVKLSEDVILKGDYAEVYYKFYDDNYHTVYPESTESVTIYSDDALATVENGRIYFNTGGKHKVYVSFDGAIAEAEVYVIDEVASCYIYPENITVKEGESKTLSLTVRDSQGNKTYVHPDRVHWISDGVSIENGTVSGGKGYVGIEFGNAAAYCSVNGVTAPRNKAQNTVFMSEKKAGAKVIKISAGSQSYSTIANMFRILNYEYSLADTEELYMFNPPLIKDLTYNSVDRYSQKAIENTLLVTINSASKTINENGQPEQIINLPDSYEKNIVIITQNPPSDYPDDERRLFFDCIKRAQQNGKNVFVVYEAQTTQTYVEDGIVYITCAVVTGEDFGKSNVEVGVEFYLLGGELNYAFIN